MKHRLGLVFRVSIWLALVCASLSGSAAGLSGSIIINEIHYAPAVKTEQLEFVELFNPSSAAVDVSNWSITGGIDFRFPPKLRDHATIT